MEFKKMKQGIAMIELIFAIVVMGIVLMSAPMLINVATQSGYVAMQQESIAAAASEIGMILTRQWDEGDTDFNKTAPILVVSNGDSSLNEANDSVTGILLGRRAGTPKSSQRSFLTSTGGRINASVNFTTEGDLDDIDDFDGKDTQLHVYNSENTTANIGDYVDKNIHIVTSVTYIEDNTSNGASYLNGNGNPLITYDDPFNRSDSPTTNIKAVNVRLTTTNTATELNKTIVLKAFSCNIGTYELNRKSFP